MKLLDEIMKEYNPIGSVITFNQLEKMLTDYATNNPGRVSLVMPSSNIVKDIKWKYNVTLLDKKGDDGSRIIIAFETLFDLSMNPILSTINIYSKESINEKFDQNTIFIHHTGRNFDDGITCIIHHDKFFLNKTDAFISLDPDNKTTMKWFDRLECNQHDHDLIYNALVVIEWFYYNTWAELVDKEIRENSESYNNPEAAENHLFAKETTLYDLLGMAKFALGNAHADECRVSIYQSAYEGIVYHFNNDTCITLHAYLYQDDSIIYSITVVINGGIRAMIAITTNSKSNTASVEFHKAKNNGPLSFELMHSYSERKIEALKDIQLSEMLYPTEKFMGIYTILHILITKYINRPNLPDDPGKWVLRIN